ncbi:uncharacterized protein MONBRDRAFT_7350 [Monosiga brevicollis MX1]|uniref:SGNH hydrolase-type esterase N-terminal domain-containing protein n=1 Tax=Monosiga brevicollis TaxID=81824 RepID=A9UWP8_MONBE|nr:uncharacterized protein MONBRDRAFT_7350 [Monosiga brevicollis MX1]EDQ90251.1 predicted protein [Monosiga brevicollis MX1]|eukprot:XP_001745018.1 hypothetical protein [Monosiga brevicollis MX1]
MHRGQPKPSPKRDTLQESPDELAEMDGALNARRNSQVFGGFVMLVPTAKSWAALLSVVLALACGGRGDQIRIAGETLSIGNRGFANTGTPFERLPTVANGAVRDAVWDLSLDSAGMYVQFVSNAKELKIDLNLTSSTGASGFDLYAYDDSTALWRWIATPTPAYPMTSLSFNASRLVADGRERRYRLHTPLYNGIRALEFAIDDVRFHFPISMRNVKKRSPPACYLQDDARKMELNVTQFLVQINASVFVIDCNPNLNDEEVAALAVSWISANVRDEQAKKRAALAAAFAQLKKTDKNLYYVAGTDFYDHAADNYTDPTVGGTHPSDLGMRQNIAVHEPLLTQLVQTSPRRNMPFQPVNGQRLLPLADAAAAARSQPSDHRPADHVEVLRRAAPLPMSTADWTTTQFRDLEIHGRGFNNSGPTDFFTRLPPAAQGVVRDAVWNLSRYSTGLFLRFATDATTYAVYGLPARLSPPSLPGISQRNAPLTPICFLPPMH